MNSNDCSCQELLLRIRSLECELEDANNTIAECRELARSIGEITFVEDEEDDDEGDCDCKECNQ